MKTTEDTVQNLVEVLNDLQVPTNDADERTKKSLRVVEALVDFVSDAIVASFSGHAGVDFGKGKDFTPPDTTGLNIFD